MKTMLCLLAALAAAAALIPAGCSEENPTADPSGANKTAEQLKGALESKALANLKMIASMQAVYYAENMEYGTFGRIAEYSMEGTTSLSEGVEIKGYRYSMDPTVTVKSFTCTALPIDKTGRALKVTEASARHYYCDDPEGKGEWKILERE
jgi:hypothetical protein